MSAATAVFTSIRSIRALLLAVGFVTMARAYAIVGRLVITRVGATKPGRSLAPALAGAGLGSWAILVWIEFS
ncbi:MAG TPA: hypothetical protein VFK04_21595 [Gemmatimonadaceae bacterium]|nr:hypothetical protein [Gemmatimonadaceae bacterium]